MKTKAGLIEIRDWLSGTSAIAPTHIAVGNDNTAPTENDTALASELTRKVFRTVTTNDNPEKEVTFSMLLNTTEQNGQTLKECGILNASVAGDMSMRTTHANIDKTNLIEVQYEITMRIT